MQSVSLNNYNAGAATTVGGGVLLCGVAGVLCVGVVAMVLTLCGLCRQG